MPENGGHSGWWQSHPVDVLGGRRTSRFRIRSTLATLRTSRSTSVRSLLVSRVPSRQTPPSICRTTSDEILTCGSEISFCRTVCSSDDGESVGASSIGGASSKVASRPVAEATGWSSGTGILIRGCGIATDSAASILSFRSAMLTPPGTSMVRRSVISRPPMCTEVDNSVMPREQNIIAGIGLATGCCENYESIVKCLIRICRKLLWGQTHDRRLLRHRRWLDRPCERSSSCSPRGTRRRRSGSLE